MLKFLNISQFKFKKLMLLGPTHPFCPFLIVLLFHPRILKITIVTRFLTPHYRPKASYFEKFLVFVKGI